MLGSLSGDGEEAVSGPSWEVGQSLGEVQGGRSLVSHLGVTFFYLHDPE